MTSGQLLQFLPFPTLLAQMYALLGTVSVVALLIASSQAMSCNTNCSKELDILFSSQFGASGFSYYRPRDFDSLQTYQPHVKLGVIALHGSGRNADDYFCILETSVKLQLGSLGETYIISPFFRTKEEYAQGTLYWDSNYEWSTGGLSALLDDEEEVRVSSFIVIDEIVSILLLPQYYPNLQNIVIVGHSGGAQAFHRYALGSTIDLHMKRPVHIRYLLANSPAYVYFDTRRATLPIPQCASYCNSSLSSLTYNFVEFPPNLESCPQFNTWKYGLEQLNEYMSQNTAEDMIKAYLSRDVTYLLGNSDICNEKYKCGCRSRTEELGCEAEMQGLCRFQRGVIYHKYIHQYYLPDESASHGVVVVPNVGHSGCGMFTSLEGRHAMFHGIL